MNAQYAEAAHDCVDALQRNDQQTATEIMSVLDHERLGTELFTHLRGLVWPPGPYDHITRTTQLEQAHDTIDELLGATA